MEAAGAAVAVAPGGRSQTSGAVVSRAAVQRQCKNPKLSPTVPVGRCAPPACRNTYAITDGGRDQAQAACVLRLDMGSFAAAPTPPPSCPQISLYTEAHVKRSAPPEPISHASL